MKRISEFSIKVEASGTAHYWLVEAPTETDAVAKLKSYSPISVPTEVKAGRQPGINYGDVIIR